MQDDVKLEPCPFCGASAFVDGSYDITCDKCGASSHVYDTEAEAIAAWNRRAMPGVVEEASRSAGMWEDAHRELLNAVMACCDPELKVCGLKPGPERDELEKVISRHHTVHKAEGPYIDAALTGGEQ